jgi:hypothetical protein
VDTEKWWVFANYGRTPDMPLQGIFKVMAYSAEEAEASVLAWLKSEGYEFVTIKETVQ